MSVIPGSCGYIFACSSLSREFGSFLFRSRHPGVCEAAEGGEHPDLHSHMNRHCFVSHSELMLDN